MRKSLVQPVLKLLSRLSLRTQYRLGIFLAWLLRVIPNEIAKQTRQNVELCFADRDRGERERIYRESLRQTCYAITELAAVWCGPAEKVLQHIRQTDICEAFDQSQRGRLILAPHLGSWETLGLWLGQEHNAIMLYKRQKDRGLDTFIKQARERTGGSLVPTKKRGLRKLLIGLRQRGCLMILPDQKPGGNKARIESRFFGASAPTTTLVYNLCDKVECDVFIATIYRSTPPGEFGLKIESLEHAQLATDDVGSAQYLNDEIERLVREYPEQYQWGYRRFNSSAYAAVKQG